MYLAKAFQLECYDSAPGAAALTNRGGTVPGALEISRLVSGLRTVSTGASETVRSVAAERGGPGTVTGKLKRY
jgi:hypothetical protein